MRYLIMIILLLGLTGCQTMGKVLQGAGNGLQNSAKNQHRPTNCTGNTYGNTTYLNCQ
jgi:hypothetical protein